MNAEKRGFSVYCVFTLRNACIVHTSEIRMMNVYKMSFKNNFEGTMNILLLGFLHNSYRIKKVQFLSIFYYFFKTIKLNIFEYA